METAGGGGGGGIDRGLSSFEIVPVSNKYNTCDIPTCITSLMLSHIL